jgi:hypothetical protein
MKRYWSFLVWPKGTSLSVECRIYDTNADMVQAIKKLSGRYYRGLGKNIGAYTEGHIPILPVGRLAIVFFSRDAVTHEYVAHEMVHVGLCLQARRKVKTIPCDTKSSSVDEEGLANAVGDLVQAFHRKYCP